jgi:hypothetical protein
MLGILQKKQYFVINWSHEVKKELRGNVSDQNLLQEK